ncbi:copper homeostasis protein CutC [Microbacterium sp. G2-8]|uniref:copper homeostasis protein CutC n=1 Tax=Microbacterium sp. G2-8 TaxID=2842454 RepID=UPI001C8A9F3D|nr:copper homeostasis protein CutC [Microbacterium sp. G2-8]
MTAFELAVQDPAGVAVASRVRPDRIELCTALSTGGVTPSAALIDAAVETEVPVHVLVRPREGGFVYDAAERAVIVADVADAVRRGASGVVVGGLARGAVDADLVRRAIDAADGREVTFHRAFDTLPDRVGGLADLVDLGVDRVLTSGGASRAVEALDELSALASQSGGRVQIMAGAGVTSENVGEIAATGVAAVHASAKRVVRDELLVSLGSGAQAGVSGYATTDEPEAQAIRDALASGAAL